MSSAKKPASEKKPKATPNTNPFGLSYRDIEIMICAWKCLEEMAKIDKNLLAVLTNLGNGDSAGRQFRRIMAVIKEAKVTVEPTPAAPGTPGTLTNDDAAAAAVAAANPDSPSVLASDKKNNKKKQATAGKTGGRKRVLKEMDEAHNGGDETGVKSESEGDGERPRKMPRIDLGKSVVTLKKLEAAANGGSDELEPGEA